MYYYSIVAISFVGLWKWYTVTLLTKIEWENKQTTGKSGCHQVKFMVHMR